MKCTDKELLEILAYMSGKMFTSFRKFIQVRAAPGYISWLGFSLQDSVISSDEKRCTFNEGCPNTTAADKKSLRVVKLR